LVQGATHRVAPFYAILTLSLSKGPALSEAEGEESRNPNLKKFNQTIDKINILWYKI